MDGSMEDVKYLVRTFRDHRQWRKYHSPKNLSMSIAIEAAELMEHFQWMTTSESEELTPLQQVEIAEELADVFIYAFNLADILDFDVYSIITQKLIANEAKYPAIECDAPTPWRLP